MSVVKAPGWLVIGLGAAAALMAACDGSGGDGAEDTGGIVDSGAAAETTGDGGDDGDDQRTNAGDDALTTGDDEPTDDPEASDEPDATDDTEASDDMDATDDPDPDPDPEVDPDPDPDPDPAPDPGAAVSGPLPTFTRVTMFDGLPGAGWIEPADLDGDGFDELLLTTLSEGVDFLSLPPLAHGGAYILSRVGGPPTPAGGLGTWSAQAAFDMSAGYGFPNNSTLYDVDNDGTDDWVIAGGFLAKPDGFIGWMKGAWSDGELGFGAMQTLPLPEEGRWYHEIVPADLDGDGDLDFVTTNNSTTVGTFGGLDLGTSRLEWWENLGIPGEASFVTHQLAESGGALLEVHDLDEDGDLDIILPQFFGGASLVWVENPGDPLGAWIEHLINDSTGKGFGAEVVDLDGDGAAEIVFGNHNHPLSADPAEQVMGVYYWDVPPLDALHGLANWDATMHVIYEGFDVPTQNPDQDGAPGVVHVGDVDGDGDMDVTAAGDGDSGLYLFVQQAGGVFEPVMIDDGHSMSGDHAMMDLDADGDMDFVWCVFGAAGFSIQSWVYVFLQGEAVDADPDPDPDPDPELSGDPSAPGPFGTTTSSSSLSVDGGLLPASVGLTVYLPDGDGPYPVVVFADGFNLDAGMFTSYGEHLASWGYVAVLVDMPSGILTPKTDVELRDYMAAVLDWVEGGDDALAGKADPDAIVVAGHSQGGKTAIFLATADPRPVGVFAIDPVDAPPGFVPADPVDYPSVAPELMDQVTVPLVLIGETTNAVAGGLSPVACAPAEENFQQYYAAATGPALEVEVIGANHFSFLDDPKCGLACAACPAGTDAPATTLALTLRTLVAFLEVTVAGDESYATWLTGDAMGADEAAGLVSAQSKNGF